MLWIGVMVHKLIGYSDRIFCSYLNDSKQVQVLRISNIPNWHFERVVFPGQQIVFGTFLNAQLEIYEGEIISSILADKIFFYYL